MFSFIDWKIGLGVIIGIWLLLLFGRRVVLRGRIPARIKTLDLMIFFMWWEIGEITFQTWQRSALPSLWLVFVLWGIAIVIYQGFWSQKYTSRHFFVTWWRIIGIATIIVLIGFIAFAVL